MPLALRDPLNRASSDAELRGDLMESRPPGVARASRIRCSTSGACGGGRRFFARCRSPWPGQCQRAPAQRSSSVRTRQTRPSSETWPCRPASWCRCPADVGKIDARGMQLGEEAHQVLQGAAQAIDRPGHDHIELAPAASLCMASKPGRWSLPLGARDARIPVHRNDFIVRYGPRPRATRALDCPWSARPSRNPKVDRRPLCHFSLPEACTKIYSLLYRLARADFDANRPINAISVLRGFLYSRLSLLADHRPLRPQSPPEGLAWRARSRKSQSM